MPSTDPIGDLLCAINNANTKLQERVDLPMSKIKQSIARILKERGYIAGYRLLGDKTRKVLRIEMKYAANKERVLQKILRVSKPGLRLYRQYKQLSPVQNGLGMWILSTSGGVMTDAECRARKAGGEVICKVW